MAQQSHAYKTPRKERGFFMKKIMSYGPIFIIIAALLWSLDGFLRRGLYVLPPIVLISYEHLIGFLLLLPFVLPHVRKVQSISPKVWGALAWITVLSSIGGTLLYTAALGQVNYIQFSVVVLLQKLQPIFAVIFGWLILKEKLSPKFMVWFVVAMIAAYLVSFPDLSINLATGQGTIFAALMAIGAAFCWASSTAFSRYVLLELPTSLVTALRFGLAALFGFILVFVFNQQSALATVTSGQFVTLFVIALSTGMVALSIYYYGLKKTPVRIATVCELVWPLSAVVIDYVYFKHSLTMTQIIGALLLLFAIYNVSSLTKGVKDGASTSKSKSR